MHTQTEPNPVEPTCEEVAIATLIVGCLSFEGYLPLTLANKDSRQDYMNSIQLTAKLLAYTRHDPVNPPTLPFAW